MSAEGQPAGLRIVTFNVLPPVFEFIVNWARQAGHRLVLAVTTPGPASRRSEGYREIVRMAPPDLDVLVTTRPRTVATPLIAALKPDLIVCLSFPYRLPAELRSIPRYGAMNLHPAPLPAYRGPNPIRMIYDGWPEIGATAHWMDDDFDTGRVLARHVAPMPQDVTREAIMQTWVPLIAGAFIEGVARAVAGDPGREQEGEPSYAAEFGEQERWIRWDEPARVIQRKTTALNLFGSPSMMATINGEERRVERVDPVPGMASAGAAGEIAGEDDGALLVNVADGVARVVLAE